MDGLPGYYTETAIPAASRTIRNAIDCCGVGLHTGRNTRLVLLPAAIGTGIVFRRTDVGIEIPALFDRVLDTRLCTKLTSAERPDISVGTIEHIMAALAALAIDNIIVEVDGPEVPILDGSAAPFLFLLDCAGLVDLAAPREMIEILRTVTVTDKGATATFEPLPAGGSWVGLDLSVSIDFAAGAIGCQSLDLRLTETSFRQELARARTFAQAHEIDQLRAAGLALGGSLDNAVLIDGEDIVNPAGLRMSHEFVRHKVLDAVGDLSLAGAAIIGRFTGDRSGHRTNNLLLRALFADPAAFRRVTAGGMISRSYGSAMQMPLGIAASAA
ncbi:UDP-3-O-acyl-N-acetylglucosamine deacetylase [Acidisoma cellulosilytica]|uniref:UDP-3-O-acyl-N-acetylglucosamine deacetylase n=1 Tax=Acidisoma cellulosilyticum TaxID=2802395 RepID=A0A963Z156_9PROT|nr:UDP-3-O-acyl-N-acetylglucosamine deacetylase [Acidisoma cellulosilyticum]MCB8880804.1 UDP-3-O-acyl-N-acetylglucosamine deacetylase [Acidisoma cellulosilyticum]